MKRYIIRKLINAENITQALSQEPNEPVAEVYLDDKPDDKPKADAVGFKYVDHYDPDEYWGRSRRK